ncbi:MAG: hypothetical protein IPG53_03495 [Ignavibacteriales bacterium]|nr:hypothetical protein [Ignavibacteriales bacterium]
MKQVLFPETYAKYAEKHCRLGPYLVEGKVDALSGNNLIVNKLEVIGGELDMELLQGRNIFRKQLQRRKRKIFEEETQSPSTSTRRKLIRAYAG